jgi:hypothetical protein
MLASSLCSYSSASNSHSRAAITSPWNGSGEQKQNQPKGTPLRQRCQTLELVVGGVTRTLGELLVPCPTTRPALRALARCVSW